MKFPQVFEATTTRDEFLRVLPQATGVAGLSELDGCWVGPGWRIRLTALPRLEIGLMKLARQRVEILFDADMDEAARDAFLHRFGQYYQRGGG